MTRANTCHAIFIFRIFHNLTMSNDIKIKADYIPEDEILCSRCKFYERCPLNYVCETLERLLDDEFGEGEEE